MRANLDSELGRRVDLSLVLPTEIRWKVSVGIFMMNRYVFFHKKPTKLLIFFMRANMEPELEH
jgi:hypothetical protein